MLGHNKVFDQKRKARVEHALATVPKLNSLVRLFYSTPELLGEFKFVEAEQMPGDYQRLLAHDGHMTVTVEGYHQCKVDVEVLEANTTGNDYQRKILLRRQSDSAVVQFGIVRLDLRRLQPHVRDEIIAQQTPLGRVLIKHNVLREVQLSKLWEVRCGIDLATYFNTSQDTVTYGRTALIYCDGVPAVELLEVVAPVVEVVR